jgi:DNA invertase Pin-like site-specific DNA recombinase
MKIGYARVSTTDQNLSLQLAALQEAGCDKIFEERKGALKERPELEKMTQQLRPSDTVIVWKLDRLGRSLHHLITLVNDFREMEVEFVSLQDNINTTTAQGRLMFNLFATFAEYERELIRERTLAGLEQARKRGRVGGRKAGLSKEAKSKARSALKLLRENEDMSIREIQEEVGIPKATYYRYIEWAKQDEKLI